MKIPLNLLSTSLRKEWIEVPSQPKDRSAGVGRVKLQEIPGDAFDDMWDALALTETEEAKARTAEPYDPKKAREAERALRAARAAVIEECVIDHDKNTFASEVPLADPDSREGQELIAQLLEIGYSLEESQQALLEGLAKKPFRRKEAASFYERCQPDNIFATTLLIFINRFQRGETITPAKYWALKGAPALPLDPAKEAPK